MEKIYVGLYEAIQGCEFLVLAIKKYIFMSFKLTVLLSFCGQFLVTKTAPVKDSGKICICLVELDVSRISDPRLTCHS